MNEEEARAVLGISSTATIKDARKAHRDRAKVFHPDRHANGTPEDVQRANSTMARINLALDTLVELDSAGLLGRPQAQQPSPAGTRYTFEYTPRSANKDECYLCGATPAKPATFRGFAGFLVWVSSHTFSGSFCKSCALMLFRESQSINLVRGWWGIVIVPMVWALFANIFNWLSYRNVGEPAFRDVNVVTPLEVPAGGGKRVFARPSVLVATAIAVVVLAVIASSAVTTTPSRPSSSVGSPQSTIVLPPVDLSAIADEVAQQKLQNLQLNRYVVGSCWSSEDSSGMIEPVECSATNATYFVTSVVVTDADCPSTSDGSVKTTDGRVACLAMKP